MKKFLILSFIILVAASSAAVADFNAPYSNIRLNMPIYEEPFPGIGNYYGALANGMKTALWNPAGITKIPTIEANITLPINFMSTSANKSFTISDNEFNAGGTGLTNGIYFTDDLSDLTKKDRKANGHFGYTDSGSSLVFDQAIKFNDWLAVGAKSLNPIDASIDIAGDVPMTSKYSADFNNFSQGGMSINNGFLTYTYSSGGTSYTHTSSNKIWSGFLNQDLILPADSVISSKNDFSVKNSVTLTGGVKYGAFSAGVNVTPISAQLILDNSVQTIVKTTASDMVFYSPNFDPNNELDVISWMTDPTRYAAEAGYRKDVIAVPEGEVVMDGKWSGVYSGSCVRQDVGFTWDFQPGTTLSIVAENFGGAVLDMKGKGLSSYANYRFNTNDPSIDPLNGITWSPFTSGSTDFVFPEGQGLYLEPEKRYELPKRIKYGFCVAKPFLIAIDYEVRTNPMIVQVIDSTGSKKDISISNINVLRLGSEMQLFRLPVWLRGGVGLVSRPTTDNTEVQAKIDTVFKKKFPFMPAKLDLGLQTEISGTKTGLALGVDALSAINAYSVDLLYSNIGKPLFYTLYAQKNNWQFSYTGAMDLAGTIAGLQNKGIPLSEVGSKLTFNDIKWVQTMAVSYRF